MEETLSSRNAINKPDPSQPKLKEKTEVSETPHPLAATKNNPDSSQLKLKGRLEDIPEISSSHIALDIPFDPVLQSHCLNLGFGSFRNPKISNESQTIFRFPLHVRKRRAADIRPRVVSIGPFFHGDPDYEGIEQQKPNCMWDLFKRCRTEPDPLPELLTVIRELETKARECYSDTIELGSVDFVRMLILDSCFIICFLISISHEIHERLISLDWNIKEIRSDLLLLENQIPFFVVSAVYECIIQLLRQVKNLPSFSHILEPFVYMDIPYGIQVPCDVAFHLLDLYWLCFLSSENEISSRQQISSSRSSDKRNLSLLSIDLNQANLEHCEGDDISDNVSIETISTPFSNKKGSFSEETTSTPFSNKKGSFSQYNRELETTDKLFYESNWAEITILSDATKNIPSATELHRVAGVVFKRLNSKMGFKVRFRYGTIEMPSLKVDQSKKIILTNLIGYEKSFNPQIRQVSSYMLLMGSLINTEEDVEFLQKSGVIVNGLSDNSSVATFFNEIGDLCTIDYQRHLFADLFKDVDMYYNSKWNQRFASLRHNYFSNPWASLAVFAAVFLLLLNVAQTILAGCQTLYTIHPPHN